MPNWAVAVIVALVGLVSGLGGVLATISHERTAEVRKRMLDAADDFSRSLFEAMTSLRDAAAEIREQSNLLLDSQRLLDPTDSKRWVKPVQAAFDEARGKIDEAHLRLARVQLLFGRRSSAGYACHHVVVSLRNAQSALTLWPHSIADKATDARYDKAFERADDLHEGFVTAARRAVLERWYDRWLPARVSRWLRRPETGPEVPEHVQNPPAEPSD